MVIFLFSFALASLPKRGITNPNYPNPTYTGSRVLDWTSEGTIPVTWTQSAVIDSYGNMYLVNTTSHVIIKILNVTTALNFPGAYQIIAGISGESGHRDAELTIALFDEPGAIAIDETLGALPVLYVSDTGNHVIRKIDLNSKRVTTIAGISGTSGLRDGDGRKALFSSPSSLGVDGEGSIYVLDNSDRLRKITKSGDYYIVRTLVSGACRTQRLFKFYQFYARQVWCKTAWLASDVPEENITTWTWPSFCRDHISKC
jgi:hypothetical protein